MDQMIELLKMTGEFTNSLSAKMPDIQSEINSILLKTSPEQRSSYNTFEQKRLKIMSDKTISEHERIEQLKQLGIDYGTNSNK